MRCLPGALLGANLLTLLLYAALGACRSSSSVESHPGAGLFAGGGRGALLPFVALLGGMSPAMGIVVRRTGPRLLLVVGPLLDAVGFGLLARPAIGGSYWTTFFPAVVVLGVGLGLTVAPLTAAVMGAVDRRHAGVASGINNAVARTAGLLAIAALGALLAARFDAVLDARLARMAAPPAVVAMVNAQRTRLAGEDLSAVADPTLVASIRGALLDAYVAAFRAVMLVCAGLAALGAVLAGILVERKSRRSEARSSG